MVLVFWLYIKLLLSFWIHLQRFGYCNHIDNSTCNIDEQILKCLLVLFSVLLCPWSADLLLDKGSDKEHFVKKKIQEPCLESCPWLILEKGCCPHPQAQTGSAHRSKQSQGSFWAPMADLQCWYENKMKQNRWNSDKQHPWNIRLKLFRFFICSCHWH